MKLREREKERVFHLLKDAEDHGTCRGKKERKRKKKREGGEGRREGGGGLTVYNGYKPVSTNHSIKIIIIFIFLFKYVAVYP
jgi:hypothetical protein